MSHYSFCHSKMSAIPFDLLPDHLKIEAKEQAKLIFHKYAPESFYELPISKYILQTLPFSAFIKNNLTRFNEITSWLLNNKLEEEAFTKAKRISLIQELTSIETEELFLRQIRIFRTKHLIRIAIMDICGLASMFDVCRELSTLAEICLEAALKWLEKDMEAEFGKPLDSSGNLQRLIILGMGKLGGKELNFSSDIDLVFAFKEHGVTKGGKKELPVQDYFLQQARRLMHLIGTLTPEGNVFRVDTRLRPFGDSGPLVMPIDAMEEYYEIHGRQWERYAYIKARPVAGDKDAGKILLETLQPFIYKKYIDYSAIESLKEMKRMILAEQVRKGIKNNIKLGPGGIRDLEFIVQTIQLLKGGRIKSLQTQSFKKALSIIKKMGLLEKRICDTLEKAYIFERITENRLQEYNAQQTHLLPSDTDRQLRLALSTGFSSWQDFDNCLQDHLKKVSKIFSSLFLDEQKTKAKEQKILTAINVWATPEHEDIPNILKELGFSALDSTRNLILQFKNSKKVLALSGQARELLDEIIPKLLILAGREKNSDKAFKNALNIIEAILKRTIYFHLMKQYPVVLEHLVFLCARSNLLAEMLKRQPILLDELMDSRILFSSSSREELKIRLEHILSAGPGDDLEHWMDEIRRFKKGNVLRIAACELKGLLDCLDAAKQLTSLAETILEKTLDKASYEIRPTVPNFLQQEDDILKGLIIVGYGKLGTEELSYSSDLDLVFLYDSDQFSALSSSATSELSFFYARLMQKMIFLVTTRTTQGILYEIDTRLRPNGSQGLLVSSLNSFKEYQMEKAWTWEHQALIKARPICGDQKTMNAFEKIRGEVLRQKRCLTALKKDIFSMRQKITSSAKTKKGIFNLKKGPGGLIDIEFLIQFHVLANAWKHPKLSTMRNSLSLIYLLEELEIIDADNSLILKDVYRKYMAKISLLSLDQLPPEIDEEIFWEEREKIENLFLSTLS